MQDTKKVAGELLVELEKKGVTFETVDGKLKYKDSKGNFTENSKEKVKKYKEEIIEILKKKQTIDEFITDNDYETNVYPLTDVQAAYLVGKTEAVKWGGIGCKRVGGQEIIERCHEDISVKKKYIIAFSEMASLCITKASELLGENIIINRIFLINPSKAKESDLYLGDISIIDGNSVAIKSWEKAVLGNVREFESNSNDIFDIIMRELENDK